VQSGVLVLVDAEQTYFQPAIDWLTFHLQRRHNTDGNAVIFNTYQVLAVLVSGVLLGDG
jgi:proline dehydrogenase